jgi:uncharacterized membrane protein
MIKQFFVALGSFLLIDGLWLTVVAKNFYSKHLGFLMAKTPNLWAAGLFYLIYIFAMVVLIVTPGIEKGSFWSTVLTGALFGFCCYATYDLTNLATLQNWPLVVTLVDLVWGTVLSASIAAISFLIFKH